MPTAAILRLDVATSASKFYWNEFGVEGVGENVMGELGLPAGFLPSRWYVGAISPVRLAPTSRFSPFHQRSAAMILPGHDSSVVSIPITAQRYGGDHLPAYGAGVGLSYSQSICPGQYRVFNGKSLVLEVR